MLLAILTAFSQISMRETIGSHEVGFLLGAGVCLMILAIVLRRFFQGGKSGDKQIKPLIHKQSHTTIG